MYWPFARHHSEASMQPTSSWARTEGCSQPSAPGGGGSCPLLHSTYSLSRHTCDSRLAGGNPTSSYAWWAAAGGCLLWRVLCSGRCGGRDAGPAGFEEALERRVAVEEAAAAAPAPGAIAAAEAAPASTMATSALRTCWHSDTQPAHTCSVQ